MATLMTKLMRRLVSAGHQPGVTVEVANNLAASTQYSAYTNGYCANAETPEAAITAAVAKACNKIGAS